MLRPTIFRPITRSLSRQITTVAPRTSGTPFLERRSDRQLPYPTKTKTYVITIPIFILLCSSAAYGIFNYQKASSSVVSSSLYSLRTHPRAREVLGDEIGFSQKFPIIHGELNQFHGNIDISYSVKGSRGNGIVRFKSSRKSRMGFFETSEWYLTMEDGRKLVLLEDAESLPQAD